MTIGTLSQKNKRDLAGLVPNELLTNDTLCVAATEDDDNDLRGVIVARFMSGRIWDIVFIHVAKAYRRTGIGGKLLAYLSNAAKAFGVSSFSMSFIDSKDSPGLSPFAKAMGFTSLNATPLYEFPLSIALDSFESAAMMKHLEPQRSLPLTKLSSRMWNDINDHIRDLSGTPSHEDLFEIPYARAYYDPELSLIAVDENDEPLGLLLTHLDKEEGYLNIDQLCSLDNANLFTIPSLMKEVCIKASSSLPEVDVHFHAVDPGVEKMMTAIIGKQLQSTGVLTSVLLTL